MNALVSITGDEERPHAEIAIRVAHETDREFMLGLVPSLLEFGSSLWPDAPALGSAFGTALTEALRCQDQSATVLIAQAPDGTQLGFISLRVVKDPVTGEERAHVADVAVAETAHRGGIGTALMNAAEAWAHDHGLNVLSLDVWGTNHRASAFYRALGYSIDSLSLVKRL
ncbi:MAG: GNAT family N-acetyltransferase [Solirubrobacteraceae bacterium]